MPSVKPCQNIIQTICLSSENHAIDLQKILLSGADDRAPENEGEMSFELF